MLPDLGTSAARGRCRGRKPTARKRLEARPQLQKEFETKAQSIHAIFPQLLKAYSLYLKDVSITSVQDNKVIIVDENTGRLMTGPAVERRPCTRRWRPRKAWKLNAKTQTLATITIQNYFRLYQKLAGMTRHRGNGSPPNFLTFIKLGVAVIPTNRARRAQRTKNDSVYKTKREKYEAALKGNPGYPPAGAANFWSAPSRSRSVELLFADAQEDRHHPFRP